MIFKKDGYIDTWVIGSNMSDGKFDPLLQLWRNDSTTNPGYRKVKEFHLRPNDGIVFAPNVQNYSIHPPAYVQAGDIFGLFQPSNTSLNLFYREYNGPSNIVISVPEGLEVPSVINADTISMATADGVNDHPLITVNVVDTIHTTLTSTRQQTSTFSMQTKTSFTTTVVVVSENINTSFTLPSHTISQTRTMPQIISTNTFKTSTLSSKLFIVDNGTLSITSTSSIQQSPNITPYSSVEFSSVNITTEEAGSIGFDRTFVITVAGAGALLVLASIFFIIAIAITIYRLQTTKSRSGSRDHQGKSYGCSQALRPTVSSTSQVSEEHARESMQDNPLYYRLFKSFSDTSAKNVPTYAEPTLTNVGQINTENDYEEIRPAR